MKPSTLGERLKSARENLGHSQKEMASLLKIHPQSLYIYERGTSVPGGKLLELVAQIGISIDWLLTGEGEMLRGDNKLQDNNSEYSFRAAPYTWEEKWKNKQQDYTYNHNSRQCDAELLSMVIEAYNKSVETYANLGFNNKYPKQTSSQNIAMFYNFFSEFENINHLDLEQIEAIISAYGYIVTGIGKINEINGITVPDIRELLEYSGILLPKIDHTKKEVEKE